MGWSLFAKKRADTDSQRFAQLGRLIDEHILWAKKYLQQHQASEESVGLLGRLAYIEERRADKTFYLAVIGEFDSGKSTFINALIGDDLLRHGPVPVTANPTRLRHGRHLDVQATFAGIGPLSLRSEKKRMLQAVGALRPEIEPQGDETRDLIAALTADSSVARGTSDCVITHPGEFLREGIVIIDTPGLNDSVEREQLTIQVIRDEADLCLVIIPATFQSATSMTDFLREHLHATLRRSVFVATKVDAEPLDQHERILGRLAQKLEKALDIQNPTVYPAGAKGVLLRQQNKPLSPDQAYWADQFGELRDELTQRLRHDRQIVVLERLIGLLSGILTDLDAEMAKRQQAIAQQADVLRQAAIADLDAFAAQERAQAHAVVDQYRDAAKRKLRQDTETIRGQAQEAIFQLINGAQNKNALQVVVRKHIDKTMARYATAYTRAITARAGEADAGQADAQKRFELHFVDVYQRLQSVTRKPAPRAAVQAAATASLSPASASVTAAEVLKKAGGPGVGAAMGGAAAGAAFGSMVFPGVGTLVGAVLGGWFTRLFGPSLADTKRKIRDQLSPVIESQFAQWERQGAKLLDDRSALQRENLTRLIAAYIARYRDEYRRVAQEQRQDRQRLEAAMAAVEGERNEAGRRRATLETQLQEALAVEASAATVAAQ